MTPALTVSTLIQWLLVSALLIWSLWRFLRSLLPTTMRDLQNRFAQLVAKSGWLRLGSWLQSGQAGAGCGSGCSTCGSCATTPSIEKDNAVPVKWR